MNVKEIAKLEETNQNKIYLSSRVLAVLFVQSLVYQVIVNLFMVSREENLRHFPFVECRLVNIIDQEN